jgi:hypothetical protein
VRRHTRVRVRPKRPRAKKARMVDFASENSA